MAERSNPYKDDSVAKSGVDFGSGCFFMIIGGVFLFVMLRFFFVFS